ncbi:hypothetical protein Nepgr_016954 [Nepenthes gracilis]|uniref:CG-1 domain-containing protein n=1 Tax=Nepenthes gracilis TaxID=150966 RepID=A0AAD3SPL2_NEPGR|nr:hypothetical protein Nepgr_016954 [Nepenthes gracilis]
MQSSGYDIRQLVQEAQSRWLKPAEVLFILQNHESHQITQEPPKKPPSGSLFLFNKRVLRFFRKDGHSWRKKRDGRTVGEAHERLKVGNVEALNCYYAHGEENPSFQRRSYWMLDPAYEHIVLVHYREITEGKFSPVSISELSPGPYSAVTQSPSSFTVKNPGSTSLSDLQELYQNPSPGSIEVSSEVVINNNEILQFDRLDRTVNLSTSSEVSRALRRLEEQLSLDDENFKDFIPTFNEDENLDGTGLLHYDRKVLDQGQDANFQYDHYYSSHAGVALDSENSAFQLDSGDNGIGQHYPLGQAHKIENNESLSWDFMLGISNGSLPQESKEKRGYMIDANDKETSSSRGLSDGNHQLSNLSGNKTKKSPTPLPEEAENFNFLVYSSEIAIHGTNLDHSPQLIDQGQFGMHLPADSCLMIAQEQKFTIQEISPEWGFATEATKVIIIGSFLCDPSDSTWTCMFGDMEVPVQIIQDGVLRCQAPPHLPGKVILCITSGNRLSCSEIREFEYRDKHSMCTYCHRPRGEATKSTEELLLLVRFVQELLSNSSLMKGDSSELDDNLLRKLQSADSWDQIIEALLVGSGTSSGTTDWLLDELLKDKLQQWLSSLSHRGGDNLECALSKKEQGIIHMISGLGYEWALNPILGSGVGINFRDINGWTALHWAARFGREKMVAALIASGASAGLVTDPSSQDPTGRTPASIAAASGHKGLAGYLSELSLTSHLSSLTLEESELSKGSAAVEAEITVNNISNGSDASREDPISIKQTLAAVRNATQAAARIQSAFRAHSFMKRRQRECAEAAGAASVDEYGFCPNEIYAASKMVFRSSHDSAALSIQKNYRCWKGRKDFLALREKVVTIQAHVRGYQVRKKYKIICWAVGILDKVVLRWRRKGVGLRGFKPDSEVIDDSEGYEDILKVFRKQKVDTALGEAVSRVLSMAKSPEARQQYLRMLKRYQEAKAELGTLTSDAASTSEEYIGDDDIFKYL